jgi:hypothetical protein
MAIPPGGGSLERDPDALSHWWGPSTGGDLGSRVRGNDYRGYSALPGGMVPGWYVVAFELCFGAPSLPHVTNILRRCFTSVVIPAKAGIQGARRLAIAAEVGSLEQDPDALSYCRSHI